MSEISELEKKINELSTNYKLLEFNSEFTKFKSMVFSGFSVFCVMFVAFWGYSYTEIPNKVTKIIEEKISSTAIDKINQAATNADKIINTKIELDKMKDEINTLKNKINTLNELLPETFITNKDVLSKINSSCTNDEYYLPKCVSAAHDFCEKQSGSDKTVGIIKKHSNNTLAITCMKLTKETNILE